MQKPKRGHRARLNVLPASNRLEVLLSDQRFKGPLIYVPIKHCHVLLAKALISTYYCKRVHSIMNPILHIKKLLDQTKSLAYFGNLCFRRYCTLLMALSDHCRSRFYFILPQKERGKKKNCSILL